MSLELLKQETVDDIDANINDNTTTTNIIKQDSNLTDKYELDEDKS